MIIFIFSSCKEERIDGRIEFGFFNGDRSYMLQSGSPKSCIGISLRNFRHRRVDFAFSFLSFVYLSSSLTAQNSQRRILECQRMPTQQTISKAALHRTSEEGELSTEKGSRRESFFSIRALGSGFARGIFNSRFSSSLIFR